jgi:hypothetical protein
VPIAANWSAQTKESEKVVEVSLSTETDQAITTQDNNVRFEDTARVLQQQNILTLEQRWSSVNPYPDETPSMLLARVIQLPDYTWDTVWTGTKFGLLQTVLTLSNIHQSVLGSFSEAMFRFLQCSWKVTIRLNSTPYHQGALCVTWSPDNYNDNALVTGGVLGYASFQNAIILSASQQDQTTIEIPYFGINPHYDLAFPGTWIDTRVNINVLNPLRTSSTSVVDQVPISVFVQMVNIKTYGILDPDALQIRRSNTSNSSRRSNFVGQSGKGTVNKEVDVKDALGESVKGIVNIVKPVLTSVPLVSDLLKLGSSLVANLDKPASDQVATYTTVRNNRGHTHLTGVDYSENLSSFPASEVTKSLGMNNSDMNVVDYCKIPALFYQTVVTTKGVLLKMAVHPSIYSSSTRPVRLPDYLAFATAFYRFYRGSIRYLFQFVGTPFYSCRFKISVVHSLSIPPGGTGTGTGFMSRIVDVKGDAWTSFVVPYLGRRMWSYTTTSADPIPDTPWLVIEALTDVQGSSLPADAVYYVNVWRAAGPDYQLAMQGSWNGTFVPSVELAEKKVSDFEPQSSLIGKWNEPAEGVQTSSTGLLESGCYMADQATTITDMMKRYVPHIKPAGGPLSFPSMWNPTPVSYYPIHLFSSSFLFWRGSRRIKKAPATNYFLAKHATQVDNFLGNAMVITSNPADENTTVNIPWYCTALMVPTQIAQSDYPWFNAEYPVDYFDNVGPDPDPTFIAAGDDFMYVWLVPPCPNVVQPTFSSPMLKAKVDPKAGRPVHQEHNSSNARITETIQ